MTMSKRTAGALRDGWPISAPFRRALPNLPETNEETLAAIIGETAAAEMRRALLYAPSPLGTFISVEGANEWLGRYRAWFDELREQATEKSGDEHVSK